MSVRLIELFGDVADVERFLWDYEQSHRPLAEALPGVRRTSIGRSVPTAVPNAYDVVAELEFDSVEALETALASDAAARTAEHIKEIHEGTVDFCVVEDQEREE